MQDGFGTGIVSPNIGISQEEALFGSETVFYLQRSGSGSLLECLVRYLQTSVVGNVLTQRHTTVGMYPRCNFDTVKESNHYIGTFLEVLSIFFRPPVFQITVFVVLATLVVEAVCHLMTDYNTDCTVIEGIVSIHIEERILQDTGRETDFVRCRVVISVYGLRSHQPLVLVYRFAGFGNHFSIVPQAGTFEVVPVRIVFDFQRRVVFPLIRITDLHVESSQFLLCFLLGFVAHPGKVVDAFAQAGLKVLHQRYHTFLGSGREVFLYIHLSYGFTQCGAYYRNGSLPAGLHFLRSRHGAFVEVKVLLSHLVIQCAGGRVNQLPLQVKDLLINR